MRRFQDGSLSCLPSTNSGKWKRETIEQNTDYNLNQSMGWFVSIYSGTLSISNTLYLELLSISNWNLGPLDIYVALKLFFSLYLEHSLPRTSPYLEQIFWSLAGFSLPISNFFPPTQQNKTKTFDFWNSNVTINSNRYEKHSKITKQDLIQTVIRMSAVKRKLNNVSLIQKCKIIRHIEKGMTNKAASEKFGIPKNTISTWMKNKNKLLLLLSFLYLELSLSRTNSLVPCEFEIERVHCIPLLFFNSNIRIRTNSHVTKTKVLKTILKWFLLLWLYSLLSYGYILRCLNIKWTRS